MALFLIGEGEHLPPQGYYDAVGQLGITYRGVIRARWAAEDAGHAELNLSQGINHTVTPEGQAHLSTLSEEIRQQVKEVVASLVQPAQAESQ